MNPPTAPELREFESHTIMLRLSSSLLGPQELVADIESLRMDPVFRWLSSQPGFNRAWEVVRCKPAVKKADEASPFPPDWSLIGFSGVVARAFADYLDIVNKKLRLKVASRLERRSALPPIRLLLQLIRKGVVLVDHSKTEELTELLRALAREITTSAPSPIPSRNSAQLALRHLARALAIRLEDICGQYCPNAVFELCLIVDPHTDDPKFVQREIAALKRVEAHLRQSMDTN